jgi:hypothetical protein
VSLTFTMSATGKQARVEHLLFDNSACKVLTLSVFMFVGMLPLEIALTISPFSTVYRDSER